MEKQTKIIMKAEFIVNSEDKDIHEVESVEHSIKIARQLMSVDNPSVTSVVVKIDGETITFEK